MGWGTVGGQYIIITWCLGKTRQSTSYSHPFHRDLPATSPQIRLGHATTRATVQSHIPRREWLLPFSERHRHICWGAGLVLVAPLFRNNTRSKSEAGHFHRPSTIRSTIACALACCGACASICLCNVVSLNIPLTLVVCAAPCFSHPPAGMYANDFSAGAIRAHTLF